MRPIGSHVAPECHAVASYGRSRRVVALSPSRRCVGPAILAVLSTSTFWTFVREFSPIELRAGRDEVDICADRPRRSNPTVFGEARGTRNSMLSRPRAQILPEVRSIGDENCAQWVVWVISR